MKRVAILTLAFLLTTTYCTYSQNVADTTDIFYGHTNLGEATVTGVTGRVRQSQATIPFTRLTTTELRQATGDNIMDVVAKQPGISQLTTGSGIAKPIIRGLGFNRIVSIVDGVRQEGQQWGEEHGLELDGNAVGSIEILKGPASLMYGSDAIAGVIIFQPYSLQSEGTMRGAFSTSYQTNNGLWNYSIAHRGNKQGIVWDAQWTQQAAHAYHNAADGYIPGTAHRSHAARLLTGLSKSWGHSLLTLSLYDFTPNIAEGERDEATGELEQPTGWHRKSYGHTLPFQRVRHYKAVWNNAIHLNTGTLTAIVGYQNNYRREYEDDAKVCGLNLQLHTVTYDLRHATALSHGWKLQTGAGGMWQSSHNHGTEFLIPNYRIFDIGYFATTSRDIGHFTVSGGLRFDHRHFSSDALEDDGALRFTHNHRAFNALSGSIGAVWHAQQNLNIRLNIARSFRAPNVSEMAANGVHEGAIRYEVGNANLKAEHSWQADLGADFLGKYISWQIALFANRIDHYIYLQRTGDVAEEHPVYRYQSGDAQLMGFEVGFDYHPIHRLHFQNAFSLVNAVNLHQENDAKYLPFTPAPHYHGELKWELTHEPLTWRTLSLHNAYVALDVDCFLRQNHYLALGNTETATPSYTLLSIAAATDISISQHKALTLVLRVDNLTNRSYQPHLSRLKYTADGGLHQPGRNITLKVIVPF